DVTLAPLYCDGAVLQRDKPVPVWGRAEPGEQVIVTFLEKTAGTVADSAGRWLVHLPPLPARGAGTDLVVTGRNRLVVRDVLVGEVWLCSGQSNMAWTVAQSQNAAAEIAGANFPMIRHLKVTPTTAELPQDTVPTSGWAAATPATAGGFTAVGFFFARDLQPRLGVPVGLIHATWGGTPIESWLSPAGLAGDPAFAVVAERWRQRLAAYPELKKQYDLELPAWEQAEVAARTAGPEALRRFLRENVEPQRPAGPTSPQRPSSLYNAMIRPLVPAALRGILWSQGESNAPRAFEYAALFATLIRGWRAEFGSDELPFLWVQLANYRQPSPRYTKWFGTDPAYHGASWAYLRDQQARALALPATGQAVAIDIGDPDDIHPPNKQEVGRRLALLARAIAYGEKIECSGPVFARAVREGAALRVHFAHARGLVALGGAVPSLELAGTDRVFHPAVGRVERETLVVTSPGVPAPVAVRYAWSNAPATALANAAGLPAAPFRSDNW
ncbi:MAG: sialate O-acetylesterase, partial [Verrucomicrobia bacterium]|nr:sialate O-acetylesterase [Verrucomicrobiota bacterium]